MELIKKGSFKDEYLKSCFRVNFYFNYVNKKVKASKLILTETLSFLEVLLRCCHILKEIESNVSSKSFICKHFKEIFSIIKLITVKHCNAIPVKSL